MDLNIVSYTNMHGLSQKFSNILVHVSLWHVYHMTEAVQAVEGTCSGW